MSTDADKYESDETDTTSSTSTTAGTKYYQISVPNYYLVLADGTNSDSKVGSSFLRLGSFPASATATSNPAGYSSSLTLAKLVGDKTAILSGETGKDLDPSLAANATTPSYNGDPYYLLGFADDTRYRGSGATSWTDRQSETTRLLTKGGWWDHSDGNRISTTAGDKIDIIQGNYKMVVLGRNPPSTKLSDLAGGALITDISGGLMVENGPSPTHCIKSIEYILDESTNTWEVYQNNGIGKVYSSYYGDTVDIFLGQSKATWTGPVPSGYSADDDSKDVYDIYQKALAIRTKLGEITDAGKPKVIDHFWADKILSYRGSSGNNVGTISDTVYVDRMASNVIAHTVTNTISAATITNVNTSLNNFTFTLGIQESINLGAVLDVQIGPKSSINVEWMQFNGLKNVVAGQKSDAVALENKLKGLHNELVEYSTRVSSTANNIGAMFNQVAANATTLAQVSTAVGGAFEVLAAETSIT